MGMRSINPSVHVVTLSQSRWDLFSSRQLSLRSYSFGTMDLVNVGSGQILPNRSLALVLCYPDINIGGQDELLLPTGLGNPQKQFSNRLMV